MRLNCCMNDAPHDDPGHGIKRTGGCVCFFLGGGGGIGAGWGGGGGAPAARENI